MGINLNNAAPSGGGASSSQGDVIPACRAVYGEARGEPYRGKVAVAARNTGAGQKLAVPNSIAGRDIPAGAFTSFSDGQINLTPDAEALRAARDAMNGVNPVPGALFFYNPATSTSKWIWSRKVIATIGTHRFCV